MSINNNLDEIEDLLSNLRGKYDNEVTDVKREISTLQFEIELLEAQNELLTENSEDLIDRNYKHYELEI